MTESVDMGATIAPKSDQLNSDDLISGPRTITVTAIKASTNSPEQPISVYFQGDNGKPYKPCKSMRRLMVTLWGANGATYVGRQMTLFCDPKVKWGGIEVGGIRISHMSHIERDTTIALTESKSKRTPTTVRRLSDYMLRQGNTSSMERVRKDHTEQQSEAPTKPPGNITEALATIEKWSGDAGPLKAGLGERSWTKEERAQIKAALEGKA